MSSRRRRSTLMVAVRDVDDSSELLRKAASLAKSRRCDVELVHVIALPLVPAARLRSTVKQAAEEIVDDRRQRLAALAARRELKQVRVTTSVTWAYPAAEGLVRHVLKRRPSLLLAESHRHSRWTRPLLSHTDWDLIRNCPCPLWLSKTFVSGGVVVAALDPLHAHAKPAALDSIILEHAVDAAGGRAERVLAVHAYSLPAPLILDSPVEAYWIGRSETEIEQHEATLRGHLDRLADRYDIPESNRLLVSGDPVVALPKVVRKHRASVVVMGAVSRSALKRLFIGHTAERVIDSLDCDVLVVKPRGFKTSVERRRAPAGVLRMSA